MAAQALPVVQAGAGHDLGRGLGARLEHQIVAVDQPQPRGVGREQRHRRIHDEIQDLLAVGDGGEAPGDVVEDLEAAALLSLAVGCLARTGAETPRHDARSCSSGRGADARNYGGGYAGG